jgi:predicted dehydrogenase
MSGNRYRVGIIGAGSIGTKRAEAIAVSRKGKLVVVADRDHDRARILGNKYGVESVKDWKHLVLRNDIDAVIVAVPNAFAAPIVLAALRAGKHVLCEKPLGISSKESRAIVVAAKNANRVVKVGFNHRFHLALLKAHKIFEQGGIGRVLFIRARYGHGGRQGMEKEWRFDRKMSGGGELLDQGVHLIDLARWFAGDFSNVYGVTTTKFWKTDLDDNAFVLMGNRQVTVFFHVSTTNWKNIFSCEVLGEEGFLQVEGKGGSYGEEVLTYGRRKPKFGVPEIEVFRFPATDKSWEREWDNFTRAIAGKAEVIGCATDGLRANQLVEAVYRSSRSRREVKVRLTRRARA